MNNYYQILRIESSATPEEVKKAYFGLAKKYHPDSGDSTEVRKFHEVAEAYRILSDENARKAYDTTIVAKEELTVPKTPVYQTVKVHKREQGRDDELKAFHRNRFKKAVFRLIGFTILIGVIGFFVSVILEGTDYLGFIAGAMIGFGISINKNFNLSSYFKTKKLYKIFRIFTWVLFSLGIVYFLVLYMY